MNINQDIWNSYVFSYRAYCEAVDRFRLPETDRVAILKNALCGNDRYMAITLLKFLQVEELQELFTELIYLASYTNGSLGYIRDIIKSIPSDWVIAHIEQITEPLLQNGTYDQYQRLLELYYEIDHELAKRLALRALGNPDLDIKEAGEDFIKLIERK
jgi:hypothetical protein